MPNSTAVTAPADAETGLLDLSSVSLQALLSGQDANTTSVLDSVLQRLFDPRDRDKLTVSAFGSAI